MKKFILWGLSCINPVKLSLKMRLTVLFLIVSLFKINASTYSQNTKISLDLRQVTVLDVLNTIEEKSEFKFFYSNLDFDLDRKFTVLVKAEKIETILDKLFANTNISHDVVDKQIVLFPEDEVATSNDIIVEEEQEIEITGNVTDSQGQPLPGVNIIIEGTFTGTGTDFDGNYALSANAGDVLVFSFIGMATQKITVGESNTINVVLQEDASTLDEVVVTALGIKKEKKALGYGSSTIKAADLVEAGPANFASALYGKAAGVQIASTPGGSTSATNITIRGINSITGRSQPLIILDGVPIRDEEVSNTSYWSSQRIKGNGLLDVNPEDIDNISILKGASAAALYGSEAVNGVILITTKSGKEGTTGMSVDISSSFSVDKMAYWVDYQNERGQGYPIFINNAGQDADGFITYDAARGGGRGLIGTSLNFGPWFDGQPTTSWDGETRPYVGQGQNFGGVFQDAHNATQHIAISNVSEKSNTRFAVTRADNKGISIGAKDEKNTLNLNSTFQISESLTTNVKVNYINQTVTNRPYKIDRMVNNFGGMMGRFDHGDWYFPRVFNSDGYRYRTGTQQSTRPEENIVHNGMNGSMMDYVWRLKAQNSVEKMDRVIGIVTQDWQIMEGLNLRGRVSTDFTTRLTENSTTNWRPLSFGTSGGFSMSSYQNKILYGDIILTYTRELNEDLNLNAMVGYNATKQTGTNLNRGTRGGLSVENWFDISASNTTPSSGSSRSAITKDAFLGTLGFEYKDYLFLEGTIRRDRTSTMHPDQNDFVYPSVNSSFVFSDAIELPDFVTYAKVRGSWGIVGNYPDPYRANIAYGQNTLGSQGGATPVYTTVSNSMGNDAIRPEEKHEYEFGLESKLFSGKVGFELSYYNAKVIDQILPLSLPISSGGSSVLTNIGTLRNSGVELMVNFTPVDTGDFRWDAVLNLAKNQNEVVQLSPGLDEIQHANWDGSAAKMLSVVGESMGDIFAHPIATHENGGQIVDPNGLYKMDGSEWVKYGNAMPKLIGGMMNTFSYKNITFDAVFDFRQGGHIMPTGINWMTSRGITKKSLNYSTTERGGLSYYIDDTDTKVSTDATSTAGPGGEQVYHDGMLLDGVKLDGSVNDVIVSQANYYWEVYNWGGPQYSPNTNYGLYIKENNYVKVREMSLGYSFPKQILDKIGIDRLHLSVYGRNLFYIYRSIKDLDVEATTAGSRWNQNINNAGNSPASRTFGLMLRASL